MVRLFGRILKSLPFLGAALLVIAVVLSVQRQQMDELSLGLIVGGFVLFLAMFLKVEPGSLRFYLNLSILSALMIGNLGLVYLLVVAHPVRWDLTQSSRYSLAPETRKILKNLSRNVEIEAMTAVNEPYSSYLQRYAALSDRVTSRVTNPYRQARTEDAKPGREALNRIVVRSGERELAFEIDPDADMERLERELERNIVNNLLNVIRDRTARIYFVTGHGEKTPESLMGEEKDTRSFFNFAKVLHQTGMEVRLLDLKTDLLIPEDADALAIVGPLKDYLEIEIRAMRDFLRSGKGLFVLLDPPGTEALGQPRLRGFLREFGIDALPTIVVDAGSYDVSQNYFVPIATKFNPLHPVTCGLEGRGEGLPLSLACPIRATDPVPQGLRVGDLIWSSEKSWQMTPAQYIQVARSGRLSQPGPAEMRRLPMGQAVEGTFGSGEAARSFRIVVLGDSDFITNSHLGNVQAELGYLAMSWLSGQSGIVDIPPRVVETTPLVLSPQQRNLISIFSVVLVPFAIFFGGLAYTTVRRRRR